MCFNGALRKVLGLNISNPVEVAEKIEIPLQKETQMFFDRRGIVKTCPDLKKMFADPSEKGKYVRNQYHLGTIRMLHWRFEAGARAVCSLEWSRQNIPFNLVWPEPSNWGTCLYATCIKRETKQNALASFIKNPSLR